MARKCVSHMLSFLLLAIFINKSFQDSPPRYEPKPSPQSPYAPKFISWHETRHSKLDLLEKKTSPYKPSSYKPQQNCTVLDEVLIAEICTPDVQINCKDETIMSNSIEEKEVCFDVAKTECKETTESVDTEICTYTYQDMEVVQPAKTIEVKFEKKCQTQMVTVCEPGYHRQPHKYGGYGGYNHGYGHSCEEIKQDACYNQPKVESDETELTLVLPMPQRKCESKTVELPNIDCQVSTEEKCINVPIAVPRPITVQKCTPEIGAPKCREVELVLPKQVCKDLIVGYADKVYKTPKPKAYFSSSDRFPTHNPIEYPRGFADHLDR